MHILVQIFVYTDWALCVRLAYLTWKSCSIHVISIKSGSNWFIDLLKIGN